MAAARDTEVVDYVFSSLNRNRGGILVTANLDFLARANIDPECRRLYGDADVVVADGMPLVWAARLQGTPIPQRITGADLVWHLPSGLRVKSQLVHFGWSGDSARRAASVLSRRWPEIRIVGCSSPVILALSRRPNLRPSGKTSSQSTRSRLRRIRLAKAGTPHAGPATRVPAGLDARLRHQPEFHCRRRSAGTSLDATYRP